MTGKSMMDYKDKVITREVAKSFESKTIEELLKYYIKVTEPTKALTESEFLYLITTGDINFNSRVTNMLSVYSLSKSNVRFYARINSRDRFHAVREGRLSRADLAVINKLEHIWNN